MVPPKLQIKILTPNWEPGFGAPKLAKNIRVGYPLLPYRLLDYLIPLLFELGVGVEISVSLITCRA